VPGIERCADAFAVVSGHGMATGFGVAARNLVVEVDDAAPTFSRERQFSLLVNGNSVLGCDIPAQANSCNTGTATVTIPPDVVARWGFTIGG
jgi:hypothetical protein